MRGLHATAHLVTMPNLLLFVDTNAADLATVPDTNLPESVWDEMRAALDGPDGPDGTYHFNGTAYTVTSQSHPHTPGLRALYVTMQRNDTERALIAVETAERIARRAIRALDAVDNPMTNETRHLLAALIDSTTDCTASVVRDQTLSDRISREAGRRTARYLRRL